MLEWGDILAALGLAAVIEGAVYALFPEATRRAMSEFFAMPAEARRLIGVAICTAGVFLVWLARG